VANGAHHNWTPDEITLTIEAWVRIHEGENEAIVVTELALELGHTQSAVRQAIAAVGGRRRQSAILAALQPVFLGGGRRGRNDLRDRARFIRALWLRKRP
jgi:hypothetical protein